MYLFTKTSVIYVCRILTWADRLPSSAKHFKTLFKDGFVFEVYNSDEGFVAHRERLA
jgi:hypothetical protein